jgi:hypothetical protein
MSLAGGYGYMANGNIPPCRFVKFDLTAGQAYNGRVLQATALADKVVGISQEGTRRVPYGGLNDGYAAIAGENIKVFQPGDMCLLEIMATVARGDRVTVDSVNSTGKGRTAVAAEKSWAIAEQSGVANDKILVRVTAEDNYGAA